MVVAANSVTALGLLLTLSVDQPNQPPRFVPPNNPDVVPRSSDPPKVEREPASTGVTSALLEQIKRCGKDPFCLQLIEENGAGFAANPKRVSVPSDARFSSEASVVEFRRRAEFKSAKVGNVVVQLQARPMQAFQAAAREAESLGLTITPRGTRASRRTYAETEALWKVRVEAGLKHYMAVGKLSVVRARRLRALAATQQVPVVLAMEEKGYYFGKGFRQSILQSVAAPGTSQHLWGIALDVQEHSNARVRKILAKHGWFQTIKNDTSHFTYLGFDQARLRSLGLKVNVSEGRLVWRPDVRSNRSSMASLKKESKEANLGSPSEPANGCADKAQREPSRGVRELTSATTELSNRLSQLYYARSGDPLRITSRYRGPGAQASSMYNNLQNHGTRHVLNTYKRRSAAREVVDAYLDHRKNGRRGAIRAMTSVIERQVRKGVYISRHMLGKALDVSLRRTKRQVLAQVVRNMGGNVTREVDHYHLQF